ncbi:MAG TPA: PilC/PilY family type IV pilus protein [Gammaproteobacteria bacterium]
MNHTKLIRRAIWSLAAALLGAFLASQATAAVLSISQTPLFITISMPANITVLLDDSGSMEWAHVPDSLGSSALAAVNTVYTGTITTSATLIISSGTPRTESVTSTVATYTTTSVHVGTKSGGKYPYSCTTSGYSLFPSSPTSGSSSTASGYTCRKPSTYDYSCSGTGYVLDPSTPTSGTSSTASGYTCSETIYNYSCPSGFTLSGSSSGTDSTGNGDTCTKTTTGPISTYAGFSSVYTPDTWHYKSAAFNPLAYDPTQTYSPGYDDVGNQLPNEAFSGAHCNPYYTTAGTVNLSTSYQATVDFNPSTTSCNTFMITQNTGSASNVSNEVNSCDNFDSSGSCNDRFNAQAAFYYTYTPTSTSAVANNCGNHSYNTTSRSGVVTSHPIPALSDDACYTEVTVSSNSGPGGTDERTNFANWWSFYRTRNLTTNTSANRAFAGLGTTFRVAWRDLNTCSAFDTTGCNGWNSTIYDNRIANFSGSHRQAFFDWLQRFPASGGTPLRAGLQSIGAYYQTPAGVSSPYAFNPQVTDSPEYVCRPNYAVVMTDGLWNDSGSPSPSVGNADSTALTLPDGTNFTASMHPYSDSTSSTMADVAFYYWSHNLRSDLGTSTSLQYMPFTKAVTVVDSTSHSASLIPYWNPQNDPASWPHMITFTVGLGLTSFLTSPDWSGSTYAGGYNDLVTGNVAWPAVVSNTSTTVYDLWHAAINSRGQFFSADSPTDVQTAFNDIVTRIQGRVGSSSAIAVNSTRLDSDTFIYQAQFNSGGWTGEVLAFPINTDGSIGSQAWASSALIPSSSSRSIYTWDNTLNSGKGGGISFLWSSLNTAEKANLNTNLAGTTDSNGSLRLSYLRGDQSDEQSQAGIFRTRSDLLGDIVNSNPEFVGTGDFGDGSLPGAEGSSYSAFLATKTSRTPMLYVGANDGMMHAFNADTGVEVFDYVPRGVYPNLSALTDPDYTHEYYVDGSNIAVDAYISGTWKTLVVGTTGAGAREVYLLDATDPATFSTTSILWDYDAGTNGDADLGYTIPSATIARMHDGDWYVIFGNGYNSTNQHALIYMYNIRTGNLLKFDTGIGSVTTPNGMSAPNPVDFDGDRVVDALYAGDLQGNVWKLNVSDTNPANWKYFIYASSGTTPKPLFAATDSSGNVQPITDRVQVGLNTNSQVMVYFGTGTYFETNDNTVGTNPPVMSFYGIIDDQGNAAADQAVRSKLLQQFIVSQSTVNGNNFRVTTSYPIVSTQQGWFMDLNYPSAQGERVVSDSVLDNGRVIFTTLIPQGSACQFGGISWLMEIDSGTGGSLTTISPFDVNGDGKVNTSDFVTVTYTDPKSGHSVTATVPVGGEESNVGIIKTPGIITSGSLSYKYYSGSTGSIGMTTESNPLSGGRISWQQIQ